MSLTVIAIGLFVSLAAIVWMAMVLWGLLSPKTGREDEARVTPRHRRQRRPASSIAARRREESPPPVFLPETPGPSYARADNVVDLAEWREERKRVG